MDSMNTAVETAEGAHRDEGFKREAVRILLASGRPVTSIARELGIEQSSLHRWKKRYAEELGTIDDTPATGRPAGGDAVSVEVER